MANENNYPNGWKDGWAIDHAEESYSPYAAERAQRNAFADSEERERRMSEYQAGLDKEQRYREKIEDKKEQRKEAWRMTEIEREGREQVAQRRELIRIFVQQKKDEYNNKSWFGKAVAKISGKSFDKMKGQITEAAERRVDRMEPEQIERLLENHAEKEGRTR